MGKQLSVVLWCLQGKLLTYLHPNSLIRLVTDALLYHWAPTHKSSHVLTIMMVTTASILMTINAAFSSFY